MDLMSVLIPGLKESCAAFSSHTPRPHHTTTYADTPSTRPRGEEYDDRAASASGNQNYLERHLQSRDT